MKSSMLFIKSWNIAGAEGNPVLEGLLTFRRALLMKAAVWYGQNDVRIEDLPEPKAGENEVKIGVKWCGICGSDLHEYRAGPLLIPRKPHPLTGRIPPITLGHEFSGDVVEVGGNVQDVTVGDRVVVNALIYCGHCFYCRSGEYNMCVKLGSTGLASDGGFAEFVTVPGYATYKIPSEVTYEMGTFVEPLAVAIRAVKRAGAKVWKTAAVVGAGPIGLLVQQAAAACGAGKVYVIELIAGRRELAKELGATEVFDPSHGDVSKEIHALTHGMRADVAYECVGNQSAFDTSVRVTGRRGMIVMVGMAMEPLSVPFLRLWAHEKEITTSQGYVDEFLPAIDFLADGRVQVEPMITSKIALDDLVKKGFKESIEYPDKNIKILVSPQ
jgi:(R,R)-butanediol dehydrogenase/meso-butanediol dehydrogenase/diacetyl reductase